MHKGNFHSANISKIPNFTKPEIYNCLPKTSTHAEFDFDLRTWPV